MGLTDRVKLVSSAAKAADKKANKRIARTDFISVRLRVVVKNWKLCFKNTLGYITQTSTAYHRMALKADIEPLNIFTFLDFYWLEKSKEESKAKDVLKLTINKSLMSNLLY